MGSPIVGRDGCGPVGALIVVPILGTFAWFLFKGGNLGAAAFVGLFALCAILVGIRALPRKW